MKIELKVQQEKNKFQVTLQNAISLREASSCPST